MGCRGRAAESAFLIKKKEGLFQAGGGQAATGRDAGLQNVAAAEQEGTDASPKLGLQLGKFSVSPESQWRGEPCCAPLVWVSSAQ